MKGQITECGFEWGPMLVTRSFCDEKKRSATLMIRTGEYPHGLQVYVTKTGKIRIFTGDKEWTIQNDLR